MLVLMKGTVINLRTWAAALVAAVTTMFPAAGSTAVDASPPVATTAATASGTTGTTGTNAPAGPFSNAPTENLLRVASHLSLRHRSVTTPRGRCPVTHQRPPDRPTR